MQFAKKFLTSVMVVLLSALAWGDTVAGVVQNAQGGPLANGTFTFQLTQAATISGTALIAPVTGNCYTDAFGNVVGEQNPLVGPVVSPNFSGGTLPSGTYFVRLTYFDGTGETVASPETVFSMTNTGTLIVTAPRNQPGNASGYKVYIGTASGQETLQGSVSGTPGSWGNFSQAAALSAGTALPASNSSVCKVHFNDELQPSFTCYDVGLTTQSGVSIPGYPQYWYLAGGSSGTVTVSMGTPQSNVCQGQGAVYPQAVVTTPPFNAIQSIGGGLDLNGFPIQAGAGTLSSLDSRIYVDGVKYPCTEAGITSAYTDLLPTGGTISLGCDVTIPSAATLTVTAGKPLFLDMGGRTITCTNTSGVCLKILKADSFPREPMAIVNGLIIYSGSSVSITGVQIGDATHPATNIYVESVAINSFNTSGSIGMDLNFVEDSHFDAVSFGGDTLGMQLDAATNQNQFSNVWFQQNVNAIKCTDCQEATFEDCLVQSNTGTKPVQIIASAGNVTQIKFKHCHFENNGDGTDSTMQVSLQAGSGKNIIHTVFDSNTFNTPNDAGSGGSFVYEGLGPGTLSFTEFKNNVYFTTTNFLSGAGWTAAGKMLVENDNVNETDAGLGAANVTGAQDGGSGIIFCPPTATKCYQIWDTTGGILTVRDLTDSSNILTFSKGANLWDFKSNDLQTAFRFISTIATGTAPLVITSTTPVANLTVQNCSSCVVKATNLLISPTAPTVSSGFGTSPSIATNNGTAAFTVNVGTGGTATSGVIGLPTATNGWNCFCTDITTNSTTVSQCKQTASSTASATLGNFSDVAVASAWVASDILSVSCFAR
jgi:hypothetical protein